jgi:flagellar basal body-associated protein FliL
MSDAKPPDAPGPAPKRRSRLLVPLAGAVGAAALAGGAWFLAPRLLGARAGGVDPAAHAPVVLAVKATVPLGAVIVNLAGEQRRYVKVAVNIGVPSEKEAKEIEEHRAQLLDLVISMVSTLKVDELTSPEARSELKRALLDRMRSELHLERVAGLYFTEFVIQ